MIEEESTTTEVKEEVTEGEQVEEQVEEKPVAKPKGKRQKRKARFSPQIYKYCCQSTRYLVCSSLTMNKNSV